jgi:hypothetical protein
MIAEVEGAVGYNAQTCFEICPDDAIEIRMLPEPFDVELVRPKVDEAAVTALIIGRSIVDAPLLDMLLRAPGARPAM